MARVTHATATMIMLVRAAADLSPIHGVVANEYGESERCSGIRPQSRANLLQILHLTRALDTTLAEIAAVVERRTGRHLARNQKSLGGYLRFLVVPQAGRAGLPAGRAATFQLRIVKVRNKYMHEAGTSPSALELNALRGEMQACVSEVVRLL